MAGVDGIGVGSDEMREKRKELVMRGMLFRVDSGSQSAAHAPAHHALSVWCTSTEDALNTLQQNFNRSFPTCSSKINISKFIL